MRFRGEARRFLTPPGTGPLLFALALAGCDCGDARIGQATNGVTLVDPAGEPDDFERDLDFGSVRVAKLAKKVLLFRNDGARTANVTKALLQTDSSDFYLDVPAKLPRLEAKDEWRLELRYLPGEIGADEATVVVETDVADTPKYTIRVKARGASSEIDVCTTNDAGQEVCADAQPDGRLVIEMGEQAPGGEKRKPLVIRNKGDATLTVQSLAPTETTTSEYTIAPNGGPAEVASNQAKDFEVVYTPVNGGPDEGAIEILSDDPDEPRVLVYLNAEGIAPALCVDPLQLDFGDVSLGVTARRTLKLTSCGRETIKLSRIVLFPGDRSVFALANQPAMNHPLPAGTSYDLEVTYKPTEFAEDTGRITIFTDVAGEGGYVPLVGRGGGCRLRALPSPVAFGTVSSGGRTSKTIQVRNEGTGECTISEIRPPAAPFAIDRAPNPPIVIPAGQSESLIVAFAPTSQSAASGSVVLVSNGGELTIPLSGSGREPPPCDLQAQPTTLVFSGVSTGQRATQNVIVKNFGSDDCYISKGEIIAGSSPAFGVSVSGFPPPEIAPGGTLSIPVTFSPTTAGVHTGTLRLQYSDQAIGFPFPGGGGGQKLDVALEGGTLTPQICINPDVLDFGTVAGGGQKELQFTITSCGAGALGVRGLALRPGSSTEFSLVSPPRLPVFLQPNQTLTVRVLYKPRTDAADFGWIEVLNNDAANPKGPVRLRANAQTVCDRQLACSVDRLRFPTMEIGRSASMSVVCQSVGTQDVKVNGVGFAPGTGAEFKANVGRTPQTVRPGDATRVEVTYLPQDAGNDSGTLAIDSDACEPVRIALEATGKQPAYPRCLPPQTFQPVEKWAWSGGTISSQSKNVGMSPVVINLNDDNSDGRIDQDDVPDVIFTSCKASECCINCLNVTSEDAMKQMDLSGKGMLRAVHGRNGQDLWSVTDASLMLTAMAQIAAGDIDGDNLPEVIAVKHHFQPGSGQNGMEGKYKSGALLVFDNTGRLKFETEQWTGDPKTIEQNSAPTLGDIDGDGLVEIVFERTVFRSNGQRLFDMAESGNDGHGAFATLTDLDGNGSLEIVSGKHAFKNDGALLWTAQRVQAGPTMVLDTDVDGRPEVVLRDAPTSVRVLNALDGSHKAGPFTWSLPKNAEGGDEAVCSSAMAAADLDGDTRPELIIASGDKVMAWRTTGQKMWEMPVNDYGGQCGASGTAAFDFEGDGKFEVVYHDTQHMYVFRGTDGTKIYDAPRNSSTLFETPVIADVDNDGHADLVMTNENGILGIGSGSGVKVLSNTDNNWASTRRVWNQHSYHVSDVNENGTIPRVESPHWKGTNSWRAQHPLCKR